MATAERTGVPVETDYSYLPYASVALRIVAGVLDLIVVVTVFALFVAGAGVFLLLRTNWGDSDISNADGWRAVIIILSFLAFVPWYFIALWWWRGQTLGMTAVRIAVTDRTGNHLSLARAMVRTFFWPLSVLPLGLGLIPMFRDHESRALHDILAGTVVVELP
ncbi:MAG: RDD family protein [Dehalococcoidia bacterium]|nr:RDD family protein [Dehalococcoidia bacterium]